MAPEAQYELKACLPGISQGAILAQRLFIGVELAGSVREQLAQAIERVRAEFALPSGLRVLDAQSWHVTLQFLGSVDDALVPQISKACRAAVMQHARFEIELADASAFPNAKRARVAWFGFGRGREALAQLARAVERATEPLGFTPEARAFQAHATWARGKPDADVREVLAALVVPRVRMGVGEVVLFRSLISSEGARYEVVERFALS